ncbi:MAG: hypothetical protein AAB581_01530, partial [Patescibacteria group bacterium]
PHDIFLEDDPLPATSLAHCHSMLDKMVGFVHEGRMEKAFRWLGFIQGVLWTNRVYTLSDLKNHNRPEESRYQAEKS